MRAAPDPTHRFDRTRYARRGHRFGVAVLGAAIVSVHAIYVWWGRPNDDEGWYLYAGRLVAGGELPYRDFAYTQTPLFPYLLAPVQSLFGPGILAGRVTTAVLGIGGAALSMAAAHRLAGRAGTLFTAGLLAFLVEVTYFHAIVKTYSAVFLFFAATLYSLTLTRAPARYTLAATSALAATLIRLSALAFALPIVAVGLLRRDSRRPVAITAASLTAAAAIPILSDPDAASFHILEHHMGKGGGGIASRATTALTGHLPRLLAFIGPVVVLALVVLWFLSRDADARRWLRRHGELGLFGIAVLSFLLVHVATGAWHDEYLIPALAASAPVFGVLLSILARKRSLLAVLALTTFIALTFPGGLVHVDRSGGRAPIEEMHDVSDLVRSHTEPEDRVLALRALWTVVDADRRSLPGMSLSRFSVWDLSSDRAAGLGVVNHDLILGYLRAREPAVVVLTDGDWEDLSRAGYFSARPGDVESLRAALLAGYREIGAVASVGQARETAHVYARR
jgi:hypothetical protein